jgi:hypothetical protein
MCLWLWMMMHTRSNLDHDSWHGFFTGPVDWAGLRVVSYRTGACPVRQGPQQNCKATSEPFMGGRYYYARQ